MADVSQLPSEYQEFHQEFKKRNHTSPVWASMVRQKLTVLDWSTGHDITKSFTRRERDGEVADRQTRDFRIEFTRAEGFSLHKFCSIRSLATAGMEQEVLKQVIAKLPPGHNVYVLNHVEDRPTRKWNLRAITTKVLQL
jgi:hypothetical protein